MNVSQPSFRFTFYRFVGPRGNRTTEVVRDLSIADGMRSLVDQKKEDISACCERVQRWASTTGLSLRTTEPFPSSKHPGKVWLEFRFDGLTL